MRFRRALTDFNRTSECIDLASRDSVETPPHCKSTDFLVVRLTATLQIASSAAVCKLNVHYKANNEIINNTVIS